ncbi:MAG TPA: FAD:protein FMN transferase, partial [Xanthomonadales bacterium]|nr:FAD:protein FMN transferase [Xanthomonadales bacterium]
ANRAFAITIAEVSRLDQKYSHYRGDSYLSRIQGEAAQPGGVVVDPETAALLNFSQCQFQQSEGCFDITSGRISRLWDGATSTPTRDAIDQALLYTGWHRVAWDGQTLGLPSGMNLDLGGIVKEYAADRVALLLRQAGFDSGYINLGGDLYIIGPHPDGTAWRVGIRHPRAAGAIAAVSVTQGGLASSGDYERFRVIDGQRYSHLVDARNGWPVHGLASVSVCASSCLLAGAVSTLAILLGRKKGLELLAESGLQWLAHDGRKLVRSDQRSISRARCNESSNTSISARVLYRPNEARAVAGTP